MLCHEHWIEAIHVYPEQNPVFKIILYNHNIWQVNINTLLVEVSYTK